MCGIFGLTYKGGAHPSQPALRQQVEKLLLLSETRGKEAAGLAVLSDSRIDVHKDGLSASLMLKSPKFQQFYAAATGRFRADESLAMIGHARLVTNGMQSLDLNNQPVARDGLVVVHNGIIINDEALWRANPQLVRHADVDTEVLPALLRDQLAKGADLFEAVGDVMSMVEGEASIALLLADADVMVLATNTGSLFTVSSVDKGLVAFLSERYQADQFAAFAGATDAVVAQVAAGSIAIIDLARQQIAVRAWGEPVQAPMTSPSLGSSRIIEDSYQRLEQARQNIRRCTRCILPETMPFIHFDADGVCNFCLNHRPITTLGRPALDERIEEHRKKSGDTCFVALSGGRDSCYGLHVLTQELGLKPVAYTYDWGMVTPLARRNQARMCGALGVEHIWVSADIKKKRRNIRDNLVAWLNRPHLGMIPLLMAGDKQFFYYANQISARMNIDLSVFCMNAYERTDFKSGFAGVPPKAGAGKHYHLSALSKASIALFYGSQYLANPGYINNSVSDTVFAYMSYYFTNQDYLYLFDYLEWKEEEVESVLLGQYDFERPPDTRTTWRIGDGTAPFYNYVYHTVGGFTEFDTFRSNQIREGAIDRDTALARVEEENRPRWDSIKEYLGLVNVDFDDAIKAVNRIPKLYDR